MNARFVLDAIREAMAAVEGNSSPPAPLPAPLPAPPAESLALSVADPGQEPWRQEIATWSDARQEGWEERAAIMEYEARLTHANAEWLAYLDCRGLLP